MKAGQDWVLDGRHGLPFSKLRATDRGSAARVNERLIRAAGAFQPVSPANAIERPGGRTRALTRNSSLSRAPLRGRLSLVAFDVRGSFLRKRQTSHVPRALASCSKAILALTAEHYCLPSRFRPADRDGLSFLSAPAGPPRLPNPSTRRSNRAWNSPKAAASMRLCCFPASSGMVCWGCHASRSAGHHVPLSALVTALRVYRLSWSTIGKR